MGKKDNRTPKPIFPEPVPGKTRICVIGWPISNHTGKAAFLARTLQSIFPDDYDTFFWFNSGKKDKDPYREMMPEDHPLRKHRTSPFVWLECPEPVEGKTFASEERPGVNFWPLGGRDRFSEWILENIEESKDTAKLRKLAAAGAGFKFFVDETPGTSQQA